MAQQRLAKHLIHAALSICRKLATARFIFSSRSLRRFVHSLAQTTISWSPKRKRQHVKPSPKDTSLIIEGKRNSIKYNTRPTTLVHLENKADEMNSISYDRRG
jgi:hypothetical protein